MATTRSYSLTVVVRQTAASVPGTTIWTMYNGGSRIIRLRRVMLNVQFDGAGAASDSLYGLVRFRGAVPTGGGALGVVKNNQGSGTSTVTDARLLDTGLTVAGVTFDTPFIGMSCPRTAGATAQYKMDWPTQSQSMTEPMIIVPLDGLAITLGNTAVIGDSIAGMIEWDEFGGPAGG